MQLLYPRKKLEKPARGVLCCRCWFHFNLPFTHNEINFLHYLIGPSGAPASELEAVLESAPCG